MVRKSGIERFCLSVNKNGSYNLINAYNNDLYEGNNREALICEVAQKLGATKIHRRKKIVVFNSNDRLNSQAKN